jgi:hypothetical protein
VRALTAEVFIGANLRTSDLTRAKIGLDLPPGTTKSGVLRAVMAFIAGESRDVILQCAGVRNETKLDCNPSERTSFRVSQDLIDKAAEKLPSIAQPSYSEGNRSHAIRVACAMAAHPDLPREQIEDWADSEAEIRRGRPRKQRVTP